MFDVLITGGTIVDGTGAASFSTDLAIKGDTIVAIGNSADWEADHAIDATGLVVSPGFIDLHSHADFSFFVDPDADSKITQGVTFEYVGNCGISFCAPLIGDSSYDLETRKAWYETDWSPDWTDFGSYLDALEKNGSTLNIDLVLASLVPVTFELFAYGSFGNIQLLDAALPVIAQPTNAALSIASFPDLGQIAFWAAMTTGSNLRCNQFDTIDSSAVESLFSRRSSSSITSTTSSEELEKELRKRVRWSQGPGQGKANGRN